MSLTDALLLDPYPFEVWICQRLDGIKGSGTLNDPYDGSTVNGVLRFDDVMNLVTSRGGPMLVHLGPGVFETKGYSDDVAGGWQIKAAIRIVGAGKDVTTVKLVNASADAHFVAIGHQLTTGSPAVPNPVDFCEVLDLTIDANLANQPGDQDHKVSCGAIRLMGNHVKVERVKAVNWGSKGGSQKPCFVISVLTGDRSAGNFDASNVGIQNCAAVLPAQCDSHITVLHVGGKEEAASDAEAYGRGPYMRHCFVDCGTLPLTADVRALSMGWCRGGIVEGNHVHNVRIGGPYQDKASSGEIVVRGNFYRSVARGPYWKLGAAGPGSGSLSSLIRDPADPSGKTALATTSVSDHGFQKGERVRVDGSTPYGGVFVIKAVPELNQFKYTMDADPGADEPQTTRSAPKVFGVGNILVERNMIELATGASTAEIAIHIDDGQLDSQTSSPTPDYVHTEAVVRENRIRYVDGDFDSGWSGSAIKIAGTKNALVRDNIAECGALHPIEDFRCSTVQYSNNKTPSGALIQGYNGIEQTKYSELETEGEDALLLTLI